MNKGLEALKDIEKCMVQNCDYAEYHNEFNIIEKELKALEEHNEILNYYGLKLTDFREACLLLVQWRGAKTCFCDIEKQKKALEIIKKYPFVVNLDFRLNYNEQVDLVKEHIDQEEYELLREVLL